MSKRLPYYQSEPAEYLAGDIMFCSYGAQGVFSIIRALYWQKDCKLTLSQVKRRCKGADILIQELIEENILKIEGDDIIISFLKEQFNKAIGVSKQNSENGKKGAAKRWAKKNANSEIIATPLKKDSESIALREDKIKEDKIKEDNTIEKKDSVIDNLKFSNESLKDRQWVEITAMQNKVSLDVVKLFINIFSDHLITMQEQKDKTKDFKQHFVYWLKKQDLSQHRRKVVTGKTNQV